MAGIGSLNEHLCSWLDSYLQPLIPCLPGFLRDSKQVLVALDSQTWESGSRWITADVIALYTVDWFLETYSNYGYELKNYLIAVTEYLLKHIFLVFNSAHYLQVTGASMGATFSPWMANVYMGWWEHRFLFAEINPLFSVTKWYGR